MTYCAMKWCGRNSKNSSFKTDGITFHKFPRLGTENREQWIKFIQNNRSERTWLPNNWTSICSDHFLECDINITKTGRRFLRKSAIPRETLTKPYESPWSSTSSQYLIDLPESKVIIASVHDYLQNEYDNLKHLIDHNRDLSPLANVIKRTAEATGVSAQTVTDILGERERKEDAQQNTGKRKRAKRKRTKRSKKKFADDDDTPVEEDYNCDITDDDNHADVEERHADVDNYHAGIEDSHACDGRLMEAPPPQEFVIGTVKLEIKEKDTIHAMKDRVMVEVEIEPGLAETGSSDQRLLPPTHVEVKQEPYALECPQSSSAQYHVITDPTLIKTEPLDDETIQIVGEKPCAVGRDLPRHDGGQASAEPSLDTR